MEIKEGVIIVAVVVVVFRILVLGIEMYQSRPSLDWSQTNCTNVPRVQKRMLLLICIMG